MKITKKENMLMFDFEGTIIFNVNDYGINIDKSAIADNELKYTIQNAVVVGKGRNNFISRIKNCVKLYNFMKTGVFKA